MFLRIIFSFFIAFKLLSTTLSAVTAGVCYQPLGCFNITDDYKHLIYRPFNPLPESPKSINTKVYLFTRDGPENGRVIPEVWFNNETSKPLPDFSGNKETKFIFHGYMDNKAFGKWIKRMAQTLLYYDDYNVFVVDWSGGNGMPYSQATANSRVVAAQVALFINNLNANNNLEISKCHLIGHSIGAHLAGYVGQQLARSSGMLGRITALDPAEPYFQYLPESVRLDRSDADFVDVIHTDSRSILQLGLGMSQAIGHIDFYPNGGSDQPGCTENGLSSYFTEDWSEATRQLFVCNHIRSYEYFIESINYSENNCQFISYSCVNWKVFNNQNRCKSCGKSGKLCAQMGFHSIQWKDFKNNSKSKKFYLKTNSEKPFCGFQYRIQIPVTTNERLNNFTHFGQMFIKFNEEFIKFKRDEFEIKSNKTYETVVSLRSEVDLSSIDSIEFKWTKETFEMLNPSTWSLNSFFDRTEEKSSTSLKLLFIKQIIISFLNSNQTKISSFCNQSSNSGIKLGKTIKFSKNC